MSKLKLNEMVKHLDCEYCDEKSNTETEYMIIQTGRIKNSTWSTRGTANKQEMLEESFNSKNNRISAIETKKLLNPYQP
jgi:hypothetical protein